MAAAPETRPQIEDSSVERMRALATRALQTPFSLSHTKEEFREEAGQISNIVENANPEDPRMLAIEVEAHKQYATKLKLKYQEKTAKLKLSSLLCQDEPPDLSPEAMEELRTEEAAAKERLKQKKEVLNDAYDRMRVLIPEWQKQHSEMVTKAERTEKMAREIQAAKLELAQLRARHPEPRMTIDEASAIYDQQTDRNIALTEQRDALVEMAASQKARTEAEADRLRSLREDVMKKEREADRIQQKAKLKGQGALVPDWLASYSEFLKSQTSISSIHQETDNELRLSLRPPGFTQPAVLSVVFDPTTYTLATAQVMIPLFL
ncbi:hypothetical protein PIIN_01149 [Serendipita indica DSM 11827]|uniref:Kinetochore protein Sos7 coiled-coil domain-containing protein n=1 Tax=Serendipita indica (strain DSM 11827) TaxID=1109443 RepID=G4T7P5_SERID|nr:hypothetical protein PIIN_01149 [Serendipita indica DSM 11827]